MRYRCICSYDGRDYCGWQRQGDEKAKKDEKRSIQFCIERALSRLYRKELQIQGSSRTDAGVHARCQVFHFDVDVEIPINNMLKALNKLLPRDIMLSRIEKVEDSFHCRYDVVEKRYRYIINTGEYDVFRVHYEYQYGSALDIERLKSLIPVFLGRQDFKALMASGSDKTSGIREIKSFDLYREKKRVIFEISADGFLYHMVRIIVAAFLNLNEGKYEIEDFKRALVEKDRKVFSKIAPACGLYLWEIRY